MVFFLLLAVRPGRALTSDLRWVDLMAKIITSVSHKEEVTVEGHKMTGEDYRYQIVKTLCDLPWSAETAISLLSVIKDVGLPKEELEDVIHKVKQVLNKVDYQSVPPLIYHLVQVVHSKLPHRVLQLVINYFNKQDLKMKSSLDKDCSTDINTEDVMNGDAIEDSKEADLIEAKGTVILHLTHHAQYNPALVQDFLKHMRSSIWLTERLVTPFNLALAFSLTSVEKFQDKILDSLKSCLLKFFREEERSQQCQWLRDAWGNDCDVRSAFITTVENCGMGWDQVSQGLVQLACSLLESGGGIKRDTYASQRAVELAALLLPLIIKRQPHLTRTVISQLSCFILSSSSPEQYIVILEKLVRAVPMAVLNHQDVLCETLNYLEHLPLGAATHLLLALNPLLKINMALKDSLIILLKKMLISRKIESRQIAVRGFLQFLKFSRVMGTLPSSQASMSFSCSLSSTSVNVNVHSVLDSSTNESLCLELLGVLKRCFSQQQEVKCIFYKGLYEVCATNPHLVVSIMELLLQHSQTFMDLRLDALNPVQLRKVVQVQGESVILVEPLGDLLSALAGCQAYYHKHRDVVAAGDGENDNVVSVLNEICSIFDKLIEKLSGCDLGDMGINTNGDFSTGIAAGKKNLLNAQVMAAVFDSLMEYTFLTKKHSQEIVATVLSLFRSQQKIVDLITEKNQKPGKKGEGSKTKGQGRPPSKLTSSFKSNLSLRVTADILTTTLAEEEGQDGEGANDSIRTVLGNNHGFQMYLLSVVENNLSSFKGLTRLEREKLLSPLKGIAKILLEECIGCIGNPDVSDVREIARLRQSLNIVATIMSIFCKHFKHKLEAVLKDVLGKTDVSSSNVLLHKIAKRCQKMLLRILHHKERDSLLKDATILVQMLNTVSQSMDYNSPQLQEVQEWVLQLSKDQNFENPALTEALLKLLFQLSDQVKANHSMTWELAQELHSKLGDHKEDTEVENHDKYSVVTEDSAPTVLGVTLTHLDTALALVELAVCKMRASLSAGDCDLRKVEHCIISKCSAVISGVHEIIQSALPPGSLVDHTLTTVTKLYNALSSYVKYYLDLYRLYSHTQLSGKFEKLVKMSGDLVSGPVYPMITYIDNIQRQVSDMGKGTKKGTVLTARAIKESKLIPSLIFAVEQYEKHLITLSRKSKINLMHEMKLNTNRDFRIMVSALVNGEDGEEENGEEETAGAENGDDVTHSPTSDGDSGDNRSVNSQPSSPDVSSSSKKHNFKSNSSNLPRRGNPCLNKSHKLKRARCLSKGNKV
ncbi:Fanconi anemia group I protein-like isoform X2 [Portunus trituberculatus]|uniref:Fanconi anemia group I protein-like isoform X2 n=1 Tax=Portunus trituberculatus TaxID=210409 RepID=UPI001E1D1CCA|nr:Fanconi anemia group I protein-like isoform X2 [Portunus trituberculatus]